LRQSAFPWFGGTNLVFILAAVCSFVAVLLILVLATLVLRKQAETVEEVVPKNLFLLSFAFHIIYN
jgi:hypothetical protein